MAEDHKMVQPALIPHRAESQQGTQCFPRSWACKHKKVATVALQLEPASQELNQLLLPLARLHGGSAVAGAVRGVLLGREVEADGCDISSREDESF